MTKNQETLKILLIDIETAPSLGWAWEKYETNIIEFVKEWYLLSFSVKWLGSKKTEVFALPDFSTYKKDKTSDKELCEKLKTYLDEADIVIGHNCVEENTKILKADLTWVKANQLKIGDKIVGFEEGRKPDKSLRANKKWNSSTTRKIKETTITDITIEEKECYEVILTNGDKVITTPDHLWLGKTKKDNLYKWIKTEDLVPGYRFTKFWNTWETEKSYEAGWLSGFIAGEGTLNQPPDGGLTINFYQRPGDTWNKSLDFCNKLGYKISTERKVNPTGIGKKDTLSTGFVGGKFKIAEIVGKLQIDRFIKKLNWNNFGGLKGKNLDVVEVVSITKIGKRNVAVMSTTEKTFFADGYAMHNCDKFDLRKINTRLAANSIIPPAPYKTIDTLKVVKKHFGLNSNKLNDIGIYFGIGEKVDTGGFSLWKKCMAGDLNAWKLMKLYNKNDVILLEKVYLKVRPWISNHHSINVDTECKCGSCGSSNVQMRGYNYSKMGKSRRWQCNECFSWSSGKYEKKK